MYLIDGLIWSVVAVRQQFMTAEKQWNPAQAYATFIFTEFKYFDTETVLSFKDVTE